MSLQVSKQRYFYFIRLFLHAIIMVSSSAVATSPSVLAFTASDSNNYRLRKFDTARDLDALHEVCANVYGGSDYLPKTAPTLAADPNSSFFVVADGKTDRPAAVGNARKFKPNMSWLEAIRTCEKHRSRGLARQLTQSLLDLSREEGHELYSCTVASNTPMQRVFEKVGIKKLGQIHQLSFATLKEIPGWKAGDDTTAPKPLLQSLGVDKLVGEEAKSMELTTVGSEDELNQMLKQVKTRGGIGHVVGLYELLPDDAVRDSLKGGRVWKVTSAKNEADYALVVLAREEKISSLKSSWVCSISATSTVALESALWHACSNHCLEKLGGDVAFTVAFDLCGIPIVEGSTTPVIDALPLTDDACLLFGSSIDL